MFILAFQISRWYEWLVGNWIAIFAMLAVVAMAAMFFILALMPDHPADEVEPRNGKSAADDSGDPHSPP